MTGGAGCNGGGGAAASNAWAADTFAASCSITSIVCSRSAMTLLVWWNAGQIVSALSVATACLANYKTSPFCPKL